MNTEAMILHYENRMNKLNNNPVENANLIRKVKRKLRQLQSN